MRPQHSSIAQARGVFGSMLLALMGTQLVAVIEGYRSIAEMLQHEPLLITYAFVGVMLVFATLWLRVGAVAAYRIRANLG